MRIRILKCIALIISAGVLIYSIITTYSIVRAFEFLVLVLILGKLYQTIEGMHVLKIRDELNEEFRKAGSPCYYECEYLDWHYVEEYDLIPSEEAIVSCRLGTFKLFDDFFFFISIKFHVENNLKVCIILNRYL